MATNRGRKRTWRTAGSPYRRGYACGWQRVKRKMDGKKPTKKMQLDVSEQSTAYQAGFAQGQRAARRFFKK